MFATGLVGTAMSFHQISLLSGQGLTPIEAAANFVPRTLARLTATLGTGMLVDRIRPRYVLAAAMGILAVAMLVLPLVGPGWTAVGYGAALGAAGGSARALEAAALPRFSGTQHLGAIRGVVMGLMVVGTAVGPSLLAWGHAVRGRTCPCSGGWWCCPWPSSWWA